MQPLKLSQQDIKAALIDAVRTEGYKGSATGRQVTKAFHVACSLDLRINVGDLPGPLRALYQDAQNNLHRTFGTQHVAELIERARW